jgi:hypothetical protein
MPSDATRCEAQSSMNIAWSLLPVPRRNLPSWSRWKNCRPLTRNFAWPVTGFSDANHIWSRIITSVRSRVERGEEEGKGESGWTGRGWGWRLDGGNAWLAGPWVIRPRRQHRDILSTGLQRRRVDDGWSSIRSLNMASAGRSVRYGTRPARDFVHW